MPSGAALGGFAAGIGKVFAKKQEDDYQEKQQRIRLISNLVSAGLSSGTIKNPDEAMQFMLENMGGKGKAGKGGKKGAGLPPLVKTLLGVAQRQGGAGGDTQAGGGNRVDPSQAGQPQPAQPPQAQPPQFFTGPERDVQAEQSAARSKTGVEKATYEERVREARAQGLGPKEATEYALTGKMPVPVTKWAPGTVAGSSLPPGISDVYGQPIDPQKAYKQGTGGDGQPVFAPTERTSEQPSKEGTASRFIQDAIAQLPPNATYSQKKSVVEKASTDWARAHQSMTFSERVELAKQRAIVLQTVGAPKSEDVTAMSQSISVGGQDVPYLDLTDFKGTKEANAARSAALAAGIVPLSTNQATQINNVKTAKGNLNDYWEAIKSKLPADAASRPFTALKNVALGRYLQEDDVLAAASAYDQTVIPQLRAIAGAGIGRITNYEMQQVAQGRPKITDTFGTAKNRVDDTNRILDRAAHAVLDRNLTKSDAGAGTKTPSVPDALARKLKAQGPGLYRDTATNTYWKVDRSGTVTSITKQEYEK